MGRKKIKAKKNVAKQLLIDEKRCYRIEPKEWRWATKENPSRIK